MAARRFLLGGGRRWLATALALWLASMTAKEVGAMLPFLLLAYERLLLPDAAGARRRLVTLYLPWIGCTLLAAGVRVWILTTIEYPTDRVDSTLALVAVGPPNIAPMNAGMSTIISFATAAGCRAATMIEIVPPIEWPTIAGDLRCSEVM